MRRGRFVASGAFFIACLFVQVVYPALAWVLPGYDPFTWIIHIRFPRSGQAGVVSCPAR